MKLRSAVELYTRRKKLAGTEFGYGTAILRRFVSDAPLINVRDITEAHTTQFLDSRAVSPNTWHQRYLTLHAFFRYLLARRLVASIPLGKPKARSRSTFYPYIYSLRELRSLLEAAKESQKAPKCYVSPETARMLLLFLYATGVLPTDALRLQLKDVDLIHKVIDIQARPSGPLRRIPIGAHLSQLLRGYLNTPARKSFGRDSNLFLSRKGKAIPIFTLRGIFLRIRRISGIRRDDGAIYQPRIQDLRHTFAVHSIARWTEKGLTSDRMLPILATYLGNFSTLGVTRYLKLTPKRFDYPLSRLTIQK